MKEWTAAKTSHPPHTLFFVHIPKTAGTTFRSILDTIYQGSSVRVIDSLNIRESILCILAEPDDDKTQISLVQGHMGFGIHKDFPQAGSYVTFLRDPVRRVISHYTFDLRALRNPNHRMIRNMTIEEFSTLNDNLHTRMLCGIPGADSVFGFDPLTDRHLRLAKENLRRSFAAVGIAERFDESILLFQRALGWKDPYYFSRNVSDWSTKPNDYPEHVIDRIRATNELDLELYEFACELFDRQVSDYGPTFTRDLENFRNNLQEYRKQAPDRVEIYEPLKNQHKMREGEKIGPTGWTGAIQDTRHRLFIKAALAKRSPLIRELIINLKGIKRE